jgi:CTP-dependent riboflavin kinase
LKAIKSDFVKSHGHDPIQSDVDVEEEVWIDEYELKDGSLIEIDEETMSILDEVYESLSEDHQDQFDVLFSENRETNTSLLEWVRSVQ